MLSYMTTQRTFTISLPPELAREVDRVARQEGRSRSEFFREAVRQYLARLERWERLFAQGEEVAARLQLTEEDVDRIVKEHRHVRAIG
jgi:metal-responsive CopG/Arc/MetJ family transcriptional regulator